MLVRKNAAKLTDEEWGRFMSALVKLKHTFSPGSDVSIYDQFVALHKAVWGRELVDGTFIGDGAHGRPAFLPWHREYLRRFETSLQSVDPQVSLPYWNWGLGDLSETTTLFQDDRMGPMGSGANLIGEVSTGYLAGSPNAFNPLGWTIRSGLQDNSAILQRNTILDTSSGWPSTVSVNNTLGENSYEQFRPALEGFPHHNKIHVAVGGDMVTQASPNDPLFFLHHCQCDRIWAKWQENHPGSANYNLTTTLVGHALNDRMWPWDAGDARTTNAEAIDLLTVFANNDVVHVIDTIDHHQLGYCYDDETNCPCEEGNDEPIDPPTIPGLENIPTFPRTEDIPTVPWLENPPTLFRGEDPTTLALGEEGGPITWVENGGMTAIENIGQPIDNITTPIFGRFNPRGTR